MKTPFGGEPMGVAIPPMLAAYATPKSNGTPSLPLVSLSNTASATGSITFHPRLITWS